MCVKWEPDGPPQIRSLRHRKKMLEAYRAARAVFMEMVASAIGAPVLVVDTDFKSTSTFVSEPPVKH
jgi:hypothetical protein